MLKKLPFIIILSLITFSSVGQTLLYSESFESDGFNTQYVLNRFSDGGQDYFGVVDSWGNTQYVTANATNPFTFQMTGLDGVQCVSAEDLKRLDNPLNTNLDDYRGYLIAKTLDVTAYTEIEVKILIGARDPGAFGTHEANDNDAFRIQYAFDTDIATGGNNLSPGLTSESTVNTGNYTDIGRFLANAPTQGSMQQDTDLDGTPDGAILNNSMTEYVFTIPVTGNNLSVRIHMDYDDSAEEIAFDYLRLTGINTANTNSINDFGASLRTYPNPTEGNVTINLGKVYRNVTISTRNVLGQLVHSEFYKSIDKTTFHIEGNAGTYFVNVETQNGKRAYLKVIKK